LGDLRKKYYGVNEHMTKICPICDKESEVELLGPYRNRHELFGDKRLFICKECSFIFVNPMPTADELDWYYKNVWLKDEVIVESSREAELTYQLQANERVEYISRHIDLMGKNIKILDVGSGYGYLIDAFKRSSRPDMSFYATDPNHENVLRLKAKGARAFADVGEIGEYNFDLITICFVLEHIGEPLKFMGSIMKYIKKGGHLFVDVPERDDTFKDILEPHVGVYTLKSLKTMADKLGLKTVHIIGHGVIRNKIIDKSYLRHNILERIIGAGIRYLDHINMGDRISNLYKRHMLYKQFQFDKEGIDRWWIRVILQKP